MIYLMKKKIDPGAMPVLYERPFSDSSLAEDFDIQSGEWRVEDGWLMGKNPLNNPGMVISRGNFFGDVMLDFTAATIPPSTHDINVMWNGSWNMETNKRDVAYVAGLQGWWHGKTGIEKSPGYALNAGTPLFPFKPGHPYHIQAGSINGHIFVIVDGRLLLELTDPDPIDSRKYGKIGFEAYSSHIRFTAFKVRRAVWEPHETAYAPEW